MLKSIITILVCLWITNSCQEDFDHRLYREAREYTAHHCPKQIEPGNTMDSVSYNISSRTYTQWYTLSGELDTPQAHQATLSNLPMVKDHLNRLFRGDTKWQTCKEQKIYFRYIYHSVSLNKELFQVTLTPKDYQN